MSLRCEYNPSLFDGPLTLMPATAPARSAQNQIRFIGDTTLVLRTAETQDTHSLEVRRFLNRSMNGNLLQHGAQSNRRVELFDFVVTCACTQTKEDILTWLKAHEGLRIQYEDHWTRTWYGIITNLNTPVTIGTSNNKVQFQFRGEAT